MVRSITRSDMTCTFVYWHISSTVTERWSHTNWSIANRLVKTDKCLSDLSRKTVSDFCLWSGVRCVCKLSLDRSSRRRASAWATPRIWRRGRRREDRGNWKPSIDHQPSSPSPKTANVSYTKCVARSNNVKSIWDLFLRERKQGNKNSMSRDITRNNRQVTRLHTLLDL